VEANWLWQSAEGGTEAHAHDFEEIIGFFASNPDDPYDLCGEVEFWLGDEKHLLKKATRFLCRRG